MPLVSGVCRAASAPMLSHGGSRLNASKPEANPKTSCPIKKKKNRSLKTKIAEYFDDFKKNRNKKSFNSLPGKRNFVCLHTR
jgi:hypothetical protein